MRRMTIRLAAAALATLLLAACGKPGGEAAAPPPREVGDGAIGHYCGMALAEHPGPKGQIFLASKPDPVWFSSVHDAFAFTLLPEEPKDIAAIYVNDMAKAKNWDQPEAGSWIDAKKAWYVIHSRIKGGMGGDEAVPFGDEAAAKGFAAANGGQLVRFDTMPRSYIIPDGGPAAAPPGKANP